MKTDKVEKLEQELIAIRRRTVEQTPGFQADAQLTRQIMSSVRNVRAKAGESVFDEPGIAAIVWRFAGVCAACSICFVAYAVQSGAISGSDEYALVVDPEEAALTAVFAEEGDGL